MLDYVLLIVSVHGCLHLFVQDLAYVTSMTENGNFYTKIQGKSSVSVVVLKEKFGNSQKDAVFGFHMCVFSVYLFFTSIYGTNNSPAKQ